MLQLQWAHNSVGDTSNSKIALKQAPKITMNNLGEVLKDLAHDA